MSKASEILSKRKSSQTYKTLNSGESTKSSTKRDARTVVNEYLDNKEKEFERSSLVSQLQSIDVEAARDTILNSSYSTKDTLKDAADTITKYRDLYKQYSELTGDEFDSTNYDAAITSANDLIDYYSQWETEDDYNAAVEAYEARQKMLELDTEAEKVEIDRLNDLLNQTSVGSASGTASGVLAPSSKSAAVSTTGTSGIIDPSDLSKNEVDSNWVKELLAENGYSSTQELSAEISEKERYLTLATNLQRANELETAALNASDYQDYVARGTGSEDNYVSKIRSSNIESWIVEHVPELASDYALMDEDEANIFAYYIAKEAEGSVAEGTAEEYLRTLSETLEARQGAAIYEKVKDNAVLEAIFSFASGIDQATSGIANAIRGVAGLDTTTSAMQYASQYAKENFVENAGGDDSFWGGVAGTVYDTGTTVGAMVPTILTSLVLQGAGVAQATAQAAGGAVMGVGVAGNTYNEMLQNGYSVREAQVFSAISGTWEALSEQWLGSIELAGGHAISKAAAVQSLSSAMNGGFKALLKGVALFGIDALQEGAEEVIQDFGEKLLKQAVLGEKEDINWEEEGYSFLLGALSAAVLNGGNLIAGKAAESTYLRTTAKDIKENGRQAELANVGTLFSASSKASELTSKINENSSVKDITKALRAVNADLDEQNQADISHELQLMGWRETDADSTAKWLAAAVYGYDNLTAKQQSALEDNRDIKRAFTKAIIDKNSTINQRLTAIAQAKNEGTEYGVDFQKVAETVKYYSKLSEREAKAKAASAESAARAAKAEAVATTGSEKVSKTGNATTKSGKKIKIKRIESVDNGVAKLRLSDGSVVSSSDVLYANATQAQLYESVIKAGYSATTANAIIQAYDAGVNPSVSDYLVGMREAYIYGTQNGKIDESGTVSKLTESQRTFAYETGKSESAAKAKAAQADIDAKTAGKKGETRKGQVHTEGIDINSLPKGSIQRASMRIMETIAENSGVDIYFYESENVGGKFVLKKTIMDRDGFRAGDAAQNGFYEDGAVYLDINAGNNGEGAVLWFAAHELTHFIAQWSPAKFKVLSDFLMEEYGKHGVSIDALARDQMRKAEAAKHPITLEAAYEEVVADSMMTMFTENDAAAKLERLKAKDKGLWNKIKTFFKNLSARLKTSLKYADVKPQSKEMQRLREMTDVVDHICDLFVEGAADAGQAYSAVNAELQENGTQKKSESRFATREYFDTQEFVDLTNENPVVQTLYDTILAATTSWSDTRFRELYKAHPEYDYIERIQNKDKTARAELEALVNKMNSAKLLSDFRWYVTEGHPLHVDTFKELNGIKLLTGYTTYKKAHAYGIKTFREICDARMEKINNKGGTSLGIKNGSHAELEDIEKLFYRLNNNAQLDALAKKIFPIAKTLDLAFVFTDKGAPVARTGVQIEGGYYSGNESYDTGKKGLVVFRTHNFNSTTNTDTQKASTILHELIHACTSYAIYANNFHVSSYWKLQMGVHTIIKLYRYVATSPETATSEIRKQYGIKDVFEFIAEAANPAFREKLVALDALTPSFQADLLIAQNGIVGLVDKNGKIDSALTLILDHFLDNFDQRAYDEFARGRHYRDTGIKYSARDTEYLELAKEPIKNFAKLKAMVKEAAKKAGYTIIAYHGTNSKFTKFDKTRSGQSFDGYLKYGAGFYFAPGIGRAESYGSNLMPVYLSANHILDAGEPVDNSLARGYLVSKGYSAELADWILKYGDRFIDELFNIELAGNKITHHQANKNVQALLRSFGYDAVKDVTMSQGMPTGQYVIFDATQVKSALPVVKDDNGNIIPLSQRFNPAEEDIRWSFRGERAVDYNDAKVSLAHAQEMLDNGADSETIRKETGWFVGMDGKWRIEIDDSAAKLTTDFAEKFRYKLTAPFTTTLEKAFDHDELYQAYPWLKDLTVRVTTLSGLTRGQFDYLNKRIDLSRMLAAEYAKETLLHEIQHAIQYYEGFESGGTYTSAEETLHAENREKLAEANNARDEAAGKISRYLGNYLYREFKSRAMYDLSAYGSNRKIASALIDYASAYVNSNPFGNTSISLPARVQGYDTFYNAVDKLGKEIVKSNKTMADAIHVSQEAVHNRYESFAGEIEARDAANRSNLTAEQRRNTRPDINRKDAYLKGVKLSARDTEYLELAEHSAKNKTKLRNILDAEAHESGYAYRGYHGTNAVFNVFSNDKRGSKNFLAESAYLGFFASASKSTAESYTGLNSADYMSLWLNEEAQKSMESIKSKHNYQERSARYEAAKKEFFDKYKAEHGYKEAVTDVLDEYRRRADGAAASGKVESDEAQAVLESVESTLEMNWNRVNLSEMNAAFAQSDAQKEFNDLGEAITKEWRESEVKRRKLTPNIKDLYIKLENPLIHDFKKESRDVDFSELMKEAAKNGNDGCIFQNVRDGADYDTIYAVFNNTQFKSADLVTRDDNGNIIPPSQRFDSGSEDIRRSVRDSDGNQLTEQQQKYFEDSKIRDKDGNTRDEYAPTFYSQASKVIDAYKGDKLGVDSAISYLKGKGVKDEEIKWSGIKLFLEERKFAGKKSVTKQELQEFIQASQLQIKEQLYSAIAGQEVLDTVERETGVPWDIYYDEYGMDGHYKLNQFRLKNELDLAVENESITEDRADELFDMVVNNSGTVWHEYKTDGGTDYREILFELPGNHYKNSAMRGHWFGEEGIIAHVRFQEQRDIDRNRVLFVEEIQSDWHNEGAKRGYASKDEQTGVRAAIKDLQDERARIIAEPHPSWDDVSKAIDEHSEYSKEFSTFVEVLLENFRALTNLDPSYQMPQFQRDEFDKRYNRLGELKAKADSALNDYREFNHRVDEITHATDELSKKLSQLVFGVPEAPFANGKYVEFVMKRLLRMAAEEGYDKIGWTTAAIQDDRWSDGNRHPEGTGESGNLEGYTIEYDQDIPKFMSKYGKQWGAKVFQETLRNQLDVWTMPITDSMKQSVLYEGQPMFSTRNQEALEPIPEEKYAEMKKFYGTTSNFNVAGYLLKDGTMLDFSGRNQGARSSWTRTIDHRDINDVLPDGSVDYGAMVRMIADGNIRLAPEIGGINLSAAPTEKQRSVLARYIKMFSQNRKEEVTVDYDEPGGDTVYSKTYKEGTDAQTILRDIDNYFKNGAPSTTAEFHTSYSVRNTEYMELAKEPRKNEAKLRELVEAEARSKDYNSPMLYHGTFSFGFTQLDTSYSDDGISFFATDNENIARGYASGRAEQRDVSNNKPTRNYTSPFEKEDYANAVATIREFFHLTEDERIDRDEIYNRQLANYIYPLIDQANRDIGIPAYFEYSQNAVADIILSKKDVAAGIDWLDMFLENIDHTLMDEFGNPETTEGIYRLYGNMNKMLGLDAMGGNWNNIDLGTRLKEDYDKWAAGTWYEGRRVTTRTLAKFLKEATDIEGYYIRNIHDTGNNGDYHQQGTIYNFFYPERQVKSADLVTYDDDGNVIPLEERFNPANNDVRFSPRDVDNRTLLSGALATATQNDIEKKYIEDYQSKISAMNAEQERLTQIRAEIKQLAFAKGKRDTARISKLRDEATKLANRISIYDKQLLRLEATKPIKDIVNRERELAKRRTKSEADETLRVVKAQSREAQQAIIEKYRNRIKKNTEGRNKTQIKNKIRKVVKEMNTLLNRGTKERNVKVGMRDTVSQALDTASVLFSNLDAGDIILNGITSATPEEQVRIARYNQLAHYCDGLAASIEEKSENLEDTSDLVAALDDAGEEMKAIEKELGDVVVRERARLQESAVGDAIQKLADSYKALLSVDKAHIHYAYQQEVYDKLAALKETLGGTTVADMSVDQLNAVYDAYKLVLHTVRAANKIFRMGKAQETADTAKRIESEIVANNKTRDERSTIRRGAENFIWKEMKPLYAFQSMHSEGAMELYHDFELAEDTWGRDVAEARDFATKTREKYGYKEWDFDKKITVELSGKKVQLTLGKLMSIYAYSKREQALAHMTDGGFVLDSSEAFRKEHNGKKSILKYVSNAREAFRVNELDMAKIAGQYLTEAQIKYVDDMQEYLTAMGEKGNEASNILYGIDLFKEAVYFPLKSASDYVFSQNQPAGEVSLKNIGMAKETVPHATNPIVLQDFDDVWGTHIGQMSTYHAFVVPIDNFNKVYNYTDYMTADDSTSFKSIFGNAFGDAGKNYIQKFIQDLNGGVQGDSTRSPFARLFSTFKKTAVAASMSVIVQQPTAILRAMSMINPKYFVADVKTKHAAKWEQLKHYAPVAVIKEIGGFDTHSGRTANQYLSDQQTLMEKADEKLMRGAGLADEIGWNAIWDACKNEVRAKYKLDGETLLVKAGERFGEVIRATQVYDSTLSRSEYMRSQNEIVKMATAFMGEPTTSWNMLYSSVVETVKGNMTVGTAAKTIASVYAASIAACVFKSLVGAARKDDEDESYMNKYAQTLASNIVDEAFIPNLLPFVKDVVSIVQGWGVERTDMSLVQDLYDAFEDLFSDSKSLYRKVEDFGGAIGNLLGIPAKNIMRDGRSIVNVIKAFFDDAKPEHLARDFVETAWSDILQTVTIGQVEYDTSLNAFLEREDMDRVKEIIDETIEQKVKEGKTEKEAKTSIRSTLTSYWKEKYYVAYRDKDNDEMARIRRLLNATGVYESVVTTTQSWIKDGYSDWLEKQEK